MMDAAIAADEGAYPSFPSPMNRFVGGYRKQVCKEGLFALSKAQPQDSARRSRTMLTRVSNLCHTFRINLCAPGRCAVLNHEHYQEVFQLSSLLHRSLRSVEIRNQVNMCVRLTP